ncbi:MAG TPA: cell division protein FtsA [Kiritimatiellia bacterium]|nr:cell division protein FtsA [Kiritimatiellia bacterium]HMP00314.1 cell division protein FtsA [Kiritimatiellia bacterium]HMP97415.1 cell division protein FtsA [Kiritimatiellia bacterium]
MDLPPIAAVEVGTSRIRVMVGEIQDEDHVQVIGLGECPSRGIRKGEIIDFDAALSCLKIALDQAEKNADAEIKQVFIPVTGGHIQSVINRGSIPIQGADREILPEHVDDVQEIAKAITLPPDREIIHSICQHYFLDDQEGVVNPIGMEASKLTVDMLIVHGSHARMRNLIKLVKSVPLEVQDTPLAGLCAALAVLVPEEKENGALVIDIGGGTIDYLGYADGMIAVAGSLAVGGDHLTNDIARGLGVSFTNAERIKEHSGSAILNLADRSRKLELAGDSVPDGRVVRLGDLHTITSLRAEELLTMVRAFIDQGDLIRRFGAGIVLTGGGARLDRLDELAEKIFGLNCRVGKSRDISGLATVSNQPEYATLTGLLRYAARQTRRSGTSGGFGGLIKRILGGG